MDPRHECYDLQRVLCFYRPVYRDTVSFPLSGHCYEGKVPFSDNCNVVSLTSDTILEDLCKSWGICHERTSIVVFDLYSLCVAFVCGHFLLRVKPPENNLAESAQEKILTTKIMNLEQGKMSES